MDFDIKFSLTVETTVFNSQQLFPSCLLIYIIYSLPVLPAIRQYLEYFIFPQDGAPAHRACETVELLKEVTPDFIQPSLWPPNSPNLNPVDYAWGIMQKRVYNKGKIANVEELRQRIVDEWERLDQRIIDGAVKERKRLRACAAAEGGKEDSLNMNCDS